MMAGIDLIHVPVPWRCTGVNRFAWADKVQVLFDPIPCLHRLYPGTGNCARSGVTTGSAASEALPNVPAVGRIHCRDMRRAIGDRGLLRAQRYPRPAIQTDLLNSAVNAALA